MSDAAPRPRTGEFDFGIRPLLSARLMRGLQVELPAARGDHAVARRTPAAPLRPVGACLETRVIPDKGEGGEPR